MIIDATNLILGRLATFAAKKALLGEKVDVINCEKAIVTGDPATTLAKFKQKADRGAPLKGPYFPKTSDRIVRRVIRGMLPIRKSRGRDAFDRVMCYVGVPVQLRDKKSETIKNADVSKVPSLKYTTMRDISKHLGGKW